MTMRLLPFQQALALEGDHVYERDADGKFASGGGSVAPTIVQNAMKRMSIDKTGVGGGEPEAVKLKVKKTGEAGMTKSATHEVSVGGHVVATLKEDSAGQHISQGGGLEQRVSLRFNHAAIGTLSGKTPEAKGAFRNDQFIGSGALARAKRSIKKALADHK